MLNKALIAAAAVSILASGFISSAEAASASVTVRDHRTKIVVRDHREPEVRDHRTKIVVRDHREPEVRDHRTQVKVRDHRSERRNEVVKVNRPKLACGLGKEKLWWAGYKAIRAYDCDGVSYSYRAMKGHGIFQASMNAYNGKMNIEFVGIAN